MSVKISRQLFYKVCCIGLIDVYFVLFARLHSCWLRRLKKMLHHQINSENSIHIVEILYIYIYIFENIKDYKLCNWIKNYCLILIGNWPVYN